MGLDFVDLYGIQSNQVFLSMSIPKSTLRNFMKSWKSPHHPRGFYKTTTIGPGRVQYNFRFWLLHKNNKSNFITEKIGINKSLRKIDTQENIKMINLREFN